MKQQTMGWQWYQLEHGPLNWLVNITAHPRTASIVNITLLSNNGLWLTRFTCQQRFKQYDSQQCQCNIYKVPRKKNNSLHKLQYFNNSSNDEHLSETEFTHNISEGNRNKPHHALVKTHINLSVNDHRYHLASFLFKI